jgi:hypothetical protein
MIGENFFNENSTTGRTVHQNTGMRCLYNEKRNGNHDTHREVIM